ncbi:protein of unknown function [Candidatus Hydrogenisulfobacillus filiaventi]|uniref:Uncharacterized protein n=1 Tax=Candidatus Hydrogenisulfobacillus filiaventi TaxID=2707344 RepID=A0A6F8ZEN6_9FIRM|nr:protein of unknown function [Candidatus Hydrogenisulfobacillus filiaventi]
MQAAEQHHPVERRGGRKAGTRGVHQMRGIVNRIVKALIIGAGFYML